MLTKKQPIAAGEPKRVRKFTVRKKSKLKERPLRSVPQDFEVWDKACERTGLSFAEFARRALNAYAERH